MTVESDVRRRTRGLDRAFDIMDYLKDQRHPLRPNEIAAGIGAPKSTVYEIIDLLLERKILDRAGGDGRVFLGRRLYYLGLAHLKHFSLAREADEFLSIITQRTRETAQMCVLDGRKYTVAMMKEGKRHFRISSDVGELTPIPWTASGRLLTAHLSDAEIRELIPPEDFTLPDGSRLAPEAFIAEARRAGSEGFFSCNSVSDNFTHCFAAPVRDHAGIAIATLCIVAPRDDALAHYGDYRQVLLDCACALESKLKGEPARS
ncbi:MAG: IclR family transcriptional regulator [Telmatospirillum sp.]|nr:IclR family transcriptional regulator [Telmatospirillum sp.]